jgi:hypothetical protein
VRWIRGKTSKCAWTLSMRQWCQRLNLRHELEHTIYEMLGFCLSQKEQVPSF